jgi:UDP-glucose 4-epimerase
MESNCKQVLVTGGAGFVGTNLIKTLLEQGHKVISVDNYNTGLKSNHQPGALYIDFDIKNIDDYSAWGEFDIVYHLAAIARIQPSFKEPYDYFTTNANATFKIAKYCSNNNIPLVYAGSSSHHSGKFKNPYTFSKDIGEEIITLFQLHYGLKASIARFYNVYGPYHLKEGGYTTLIGAWEKQVEKHQPLIIYGDGTKRRDFTHINDIVEALLLINEKQAWGHIFELGRGKNYSVKDIADMFGQEIEYKENKPGEAEITLCVDTLAKRLLEWEPKHNIEDYIKDYLNG